MIKIAGNPLDPKALDDQYPDGSFEQSLLNKMSDTQVDYDSLEQLQFELELRKTSVLAAKALDQSKLDFAVFRKSRCNPHYWKRTDEGGFLLKDNVQSSAAIQDIYENSDDYATECATATVIVYLKAVLDVYPPALYDQAFPEIYLMNWHSVSPLLKGIGSLKTVQTLLPGDRIYFANPDVDPKTPEWQGENTVMLDTDRFYGPGLGIHSRDTMIKLLNEHRMRGSDESAYMINQAGRPDYQRLFKVRQDYHP